MENGSCLVGDRRVDHLQHEHALARVRGHADPAVADAELGVGHRHQRSAARVAEQHDRLGAAADHLVVRGVDVDDARLVQAVGVVVHVPGPEAEHGVTRGSEQRTGVVHTEVASRMRQDDGGLPGRADRRCPQHPAHERAVRRDEPNRFALHRSTGIVLRQGPVSEAERSSSSEHRVEWFHFGKVGARRSADRHRATATVAATAAHAVGAAPDPMILAETTTATTEKVFVVLTVVLIVGPFLIGKLRLPATIGLVLGGAIVGPQTLGWIDRGQMDALGDIGLLYLMFMAGLELDLILFKRYRNAALGFGVITFTCPFVIGIVVGQLLGYSVATSILLGSIWASHTLVSLPEVKQAGLTGDRSVALTVSATALTDTPR